MADRQDPKHRDADEGRDEANRRDTEQGAQELPSYTPQGRTDDETEPLDGPNNTPQGRVDDN